MEPTRDAARATRGAPSPPLIRRLDANDASAFMRLRADALTREPLAFGSSPETDRFRALDATRELLGRGERAPTYGAFDDATQNARLVGSVGLVCESAPKAAHRATVWGMYVAADARGRGVGRALMAALLEHARGLDGIDWVQLDVSTAADDARRLYERCGFVAWGHEPDGLRANGVSTDVLHTALLLHRAV